MCYLCVRYQVHDTTIHQTHRPSNFLSRCVLSFLWRGRVGDCVDGPPVIIGASPYAWLFVPFGAPWSILPSPFTLDLRSSLLTLGRAQASLALLSLTRSLHHYIMFTQDVVPSAVSAAVMMLASTWRIILHPSLFFILFPPFFILSHRFERSR